MIFSELVRDDPQAIGPILFVCRQWHDVARNSPTLWSSISAHFIPHIPIVERMSDYIRTAIRYSGNTPLHVDIRLPSLNSLLWYMAHKIMDQPVDYQAVWNIPENPTTDIGMVYEHLVSSYESSPDSRLPCIRINSAICNEMFQVGEALETNIFRLSSLALHFHSRSFSEWLLVKTITCFSNESLPLTPAAMLEELTVVDNDLFEGIARRNFFGHPIASLVRLSWGSVWRVESVLTPLGRLTHLRLLVGVLPETDYTCNITHMLLEFSDFEGGCYLYRERFSFPSLQDLTLYGYVPMDILKIPQLSVLRLIDDKSRRSVLDDPPYCPSLERLHVWASSHALKSLDIYLTQQSSLIEVAVLYSEERSIRCIVKEMKPTKSSKLTVKCYLYNPETRWSFDSYELNEILLEDMESSITCK